MTETVSTELALTIQPRLQSIVAADFFKPHGSDELLGALKTEVLERAAQLDISTDDGRKGIASLAYKVARTKTALDSEGKKLTEELRIQKAAVDGERGRIWDQLEELQKQVRKPLTDWENAEKSRVAGHEEALARIASIAALDRPLNLNEIEAKIAEVNAIYARDWQGFGQRAAGAKALALSDLAAAVQRAKEAIAERERLEREAAEARERAIKEREEAAAKAAKEEAERKAAEQARLAREAAEAERLRIENERIQAEARARQAEAQRIEAERLAAERERLAEEKRVEDLRQAELRRQREAADAERRAKEAEEKAERDRLAAIEAERQRVAAEEKRKREEAEARERNKKHAQKINGEAKAALLNHTNLTAENAEEVIKAIVKGLVPHVTISY